MLPCIFGTKTLTLRHEEGSQLLLERFLRLCEAKLVAWGLSFYQPHDKVLLQDGSIHNVNMTTRNKR